VQLNLKLDEYLMSFFKKIINLFFWLLEGPKGEGGRKKKAQMGGCSFENRTGGTEENSRFLNIFLV
jgi:hypothetical protein